MKVTGRVIRPRIGYETFADLTTAAIVGIERDGITFDADLTPVEYDAVWDRMTSRDAEDRMARARLVALRAAAVTGTGADVKALVLALSAYLLGD